MVESEIIQPGTGWGVMLRPSTAQSARMIIRCENDMEFELCDSWLRAEAENNNCGIVVNSVCEMHS